jgi:phenylalanyl-tRNA synthetase beta subunit
VLVQYPPCFKDIAFWVNDEFTENNFCELVRGEAGDLVEEVNLTCSPRSVTSFSVSLILTLDYLFDAEVSAFTFL